MSDPTATYSDLGRVTFEAMNPGKVFTHLSAHEMQRWEAAADAVRRATPAGKVLHRLSEIAACLGAHWPDDPADEESIRRITWLTREFNKRTPVVGEPAVSLLRQALAALESCGAGAIEDGGQQWFDDKLVDAAHDAIQSYLAAPAAAVPESPADKKGGAS